MLPYLIALGALTLNTHLGSIPKTPRILNANKKAPVSVAQRRLAVAPKALNSPNRNEWQKEDFEPSLIPKDVVKQPGIVLENPHPQALNELEDEDDDVYGECNIENPGDCQQLSDDFDAKMNEKFLTAAKTNNLKKIVQFIDYGFLTNPDVKNEDGDTALILAAKQGNEDLVKILLNENADINAENSKGCVAIVYSALRKHNAITVELLDQVENERNKDQLSQLLLYLAKWSTNVELQNILTLRKFKFNHEFKIGAKAFKLFQNCQ